MPDQTQTILSVPDMECAACLRVVTAAVHELDPGAKITADLATRQVTITADEQKDFSAAIAAAGFTVAR